MLHTYDKIYMLKKIKEQLTNWKSENNSKFALDLHLSSPKIQ